MRQSLGHRISQLRQKKGLTQKALAESLNVDKHTVWRWEDGRSWPDYDKLENIADALGTDIEALFHELVDKNYFPKPTLQEALEVIRQALEKPTPKAKEESDILPEDILNLWSKLNDIGREKARAQLSSLASIPDNCLKLGKKKNSIG